MSSSPRSPDLDKKVDLQHLEHESVAEAGPSSHGNGDEALEILGDQSSPISISDKDDARVLRKIDIWIMPVIVIVYALQQLDKSSLSYTSVFGIVEETGLVGRQYSWLGSIVYVAQLISQPITSYFLVRLPVAKYLFVNVVMWGIIVASMAAAHNFAGLLTARFFLGIFEASVAPAFITITQMWWRRREQTMRLAIWMAANGGTGMFGSVLAYGVGHIKGDLHAYQTIFLFIGLLTIVLSPLVYFILPDSPSKARFLTKDEKLIAIERLRANNMGMETKVWKWTQVREVALDLKTYLWFSLLFLCALPSGGIGTFGPLIIKGFGFDQFQTLLFNIPFAALQVVLTLTSAWVAQRIKLKWPVLFFLCLPPIAGGSALYVLGRGPEFRNKLLACYYVLSFFTAIQPMCYTWASQNTAGHTKKLCITGIVFVAQCAGNIVGPLLYRTEDAPFYHPGLIADLICWILLAIFTLATAAYLTLLNKRHAAARRRAGKSHDVVDTSLEKSNRARELQKAQQEAGMHARAFDDLTDLLNEDFMYAL